MSSYSQILWQVLCQDVVNLAMELLLAGLALGLPVIVLGHVPMLRDAVPSPLTAWRGIAYSWICGLGCYLVIQALGMSRSLLAAAENGAVQKADTMLLGGLAGLLVALSVEWRYFRRVKQRLLQPPAQDATATTPRRWIITLRSLIVGQLIFASILGLWVTSRRQEIDRLLQVERSERKSKWAEARFAPYGARPRLLPEGGKDRLSLLFEGSSPDHFQDADLSEITSDDLAVKISISSDRLTDNGLGVIGKLTTLESLVIGSSRITDVGLADLELLSKLQELEIHGTKVTDEGLSSLAAFPDLRRVVLECPQITDRGLAYLARCPTLDELTISGGSFTAAGFQSLGAAPQLKQLRLHSSKLANSALGSLSNLKTLRTLYVESNLITDDEVADLVLVSQITRLDLRSNSISKKSLDYFSNMKSLRKLTVFGSPLTQADEAKLRASHPELEATLEDPWY
jgi:hypothetical protein